MTTLLGFLFVISICVFVHEFGHFAVAKLFGFRVYVFSFGFGRRLLGKKVGGTDYRISLLPLGGYVKLSGENPEEDTDDPNAFSKKPRWQRLLVVFAGPASSAVLGVVLLAGIYTVSYTRPAHLDEKPVVGYIGVSTRASSAGLAVGDRITRVNDRVVSTWEEAAIALALGSRKTVQLGIEREGRRLTLTLSLEEMEFSGPGSAGFLPAEPLIVGSVQDDSPAARAGLTPGDEILEVGSVPVASVLSFREAIQKSAGTSLDVLVRHGTATYRLSLAPAYDEQQKLWLVGLMFDQRITQTSLPPRQALEASWRENAGIVTSSIAFLKGLFAGTSSPTLVAGPIRIAKMSGETARAGMIPLLALAAIISTALAFMNFLPIPALDGGVMLILLVEMLFRRDFGARFKTALQYAGTACIIGIAVFAVLNDLNSLESKPAFGSLPQPAQLAIICIMIFALLFRLGIRAMKRKKK